MPRVNKERTRQRKIEACKSAGVDDDICEWLLDYEESQGEQVDWDSVEDASYGWPHQKIKFCNKDGDCFEMMESNDAAVALAEEQVRQDLEHEPELFNQGWLLGIIDKEDLAQDLAEEDWYDWLDPEEEMTGAELNKMEETDEYEPEKTYYKGFGEWRTEEQWIESHYDGIMDEFDIYFPPETLKNYIDIDSAAEDAVDTDGWEHFLSRYDGHSYETNKGHVFWKES